MQLDAARRQGGKANPQVLVNFPTDTPYLLVSRGIVQDWDDESGYCGMIVCADEASALAAIAEKASGGGISPARVGSVQGELLDDHIYAAMQRGSMGVWYLWLLGGELQSKFYVW